jgi:hypothetical protein
MKKLPHRTPFLYCGRVPKIGTYVKMKKVTGPIPHPGKNIYFFKNDVFPPLSVIVFPEDHVQVFGANFGEAIGQVHAVIVVVAAVADVVVVAAVSVVVVVADVAFVDVVTVLSSVGAAAFSSGSALKPRRQVAPARKVPPMGGIRIVATGAQTRRLGGGKTEKDEKLYFIVCIFA